jgi:hypothetical protein
MNELIPMSEVKEMAAAACKSGLFGLPSAEAAMALMLLCQSEGIHPMQALKRYHIIKGRPAMRADSMLAEFQRMGGKVEWLERTDKVVSAMFTHEASGSCKFEWTIEMAKTAGLIGNPTWQKFPRQMLTARVISEACRTMLPGVVCGIYTPEEVADFDEPAPRQKSSRGSAETTRPAVVKNEPTKIPVEDVAVEIQAEEIERPTLADRTIGDHKPADEFSPEDAVVVDPIPEVKPAARPVKAEAVIPAKQIAEELKQIRQLAIDAGALNQDEIRKLVGDIVGRAIGSATELSDSERTQVIDALKSM